MSTNPDSKPWAIPVFSSNLGNSPAAQTPPSESAEKLLKAAKIASQEILAKARADAEKILNEAEASGRERGYQEGMVSAQETSLSLRKQQIQDFQDIVDELHKSYARQEQQYLEDLSLHLTELATVVCQKMVENLDRASLPREEIHQAILSLGHQSKIKIRVHPDSQENWPNHLPIHLTKDDSLEPGDFHLEGDSGSVDGTWSARWTRLLEAIEISKHSQQEEHHD